MKQVITQENAIKNNYPVLCQKSGDLTRGYSQSLAFKLKIVTMLFLHFDRSFLHLYARKNGQHTKILRWVYFSDHRPVSRAKT